MTYKLKSIFYLTFLLCSIALYYATEQDAETKLVNNTENSGEYPEIDAKI